MKILRSHVVLKAKRDTAGEFIKRKARLVAEDYAQVYGLDFDLSHAPVAAFTVVQIVLSISARKSHVVHSLDLSNAFVRVPLS
jgi:Reverse transcriptase (RNA-dependent DNA polymerase)